MPNGVHWDDSQLQRRCTSVRNHFPAYTGKALFEEIDEVEVPECQKEVPYKTGALHDTIHAAGPFYNNGWVSATIGAGNEDVDYAIKVHEDLDAFHPRGKAKFIEDPLFQSRPFIGARLAARMDLGKMVIE